ncbi:MAG: hypothetical protein AAB449_02465 [Patescibacteria group bacterium]
MRNLNLDTALRLYPKLKEVIPCTSPDGGISRRHGDRIESIRDMHIDEPNVVLEYYNDDVAQETELGSDMVVDHTVIRHTIAVCHRLSRPTEYLNIQGGCSHHLGEDRQRSPAKSLWDALVELKDFDYVVVFTSVTDERTRSRWDDDRIDYSAPWSEGVEEYWDIDIILPPKDSLFGTLWHRGKDGIIRDPTAKGPFNGIRGLEELKKRISAY